MPDQSRLSQFSLELGIPVWRFAVDDIIVEREVVMLHGQNTALMSWRLLEGADRIALELRPFLNFRPHDASVREQPDQSYQVTVAGDRYEISAGVGQPMLRLQLRGEAPAFTLEGGMRREIGYATEARRGYDSRGTLWTPGVMSVTLDRQHEATTLVASTEPWAEVTALRPMDALRAERARRLRLIDQAHPALHDGPADELVIAADSFIIAPPRDTVTAADDGHLARTVIAGYHWFTDWGRDTMISLEGLALLTGRHDEARGILRTFARNIRDGLIPNLFPEHGGEGLYNTADATLWFFHALDRYLAATGDRELLRELLPTLTDIVEHHLAGTLFGIGVDHDDGLLRQGAEGYQLTWMDAKVDDWVVTPRRGKAVEINALWYNALRLLAGWVEEDQAYDPAAPDRAGGGGAAVVQPALLVRGRRLSLRRRRRRARRRHQLPAQPDLRAVAAPSGARAQPLAGGGRGRAAAAADPGRPALAVGRSSRLPVALLTAICAPAMPPITRERSGPG